MSSRFFFFLSIRGFAFEPSRLCRHPSIRTLCGAIVARCKLGVLDSVGAATCESTSVPPFRRELVQDLSQSPDLGGRARLFGYHLFLFPALFSLLSFLCPCFSLFPTEKFRARIAQERRSPTPSTPIYSARKLGGQFNNATSSAHCTHPGRKSGCILSGDSEQKRCVALAHLKTSQSFGWATRRAA